MTKILGKVRMLKIILNINKATIRGKCLQDTQEKITFYMAVLIEAVISVLPRKYVIAMLSV